MVAVEETDELVTRGVSDVFGKFGGLRDRFALPADCKQASICCIGDGTLAMD